MVISSNANENIKKVIKLKDKKNRIKYGEYVVEGVTLVSSIPSTEEIVALYINENARHELVEISEKFDCIKYEVSDNIFNKIADTVSPSGILAVLKIPNLPISSPNGNSLILDRISDPGNMGTIIRTACACGFNDIYTVNCVDIYSSKTIRSTMGGIWSVNIYNTDYDEIRKIIRIPIISLDMNGENIFDTDVVTPCALAIGSESQGISKEILAITERVISLPMNRGIESLNAGVACGIAMYIIGGKNVRSQ